MTPVSHHSLLDAQPLAAADERMLVNTARGLKRAAADGTASTPLRGKNIALLCADADCACAREFDAAARSLGARVSRIDPEPDWLRGDVSPSPDTARLLGRLYDAIGCEEMPAGFAQRLQHQVGVPVYDGLARGDHAIARLVPQVAEPGAAPDPLDRHYLMQAVLVETMA
jgi:ornithine carbamoyltransferase